MRVIGGEFRSRRLKSMPGDLIRPTPDRLRESLFNILAPRIQGVTFVDAYAGTGAVGIEALSRGAASAIFIEKNRDAVELLEENLKSLGLTARARVLRGSAQLLLPKHASGIVFLDPPYPQVKEYDTAMDVLPGSDPELVIVQHHVKQTLGENYGQLDRYRVVRQGDNCLSFYAPSDDRES
jgi:16S rRNA (guanine966-N2)-methyltransferase